MLKVVFMGSPEYSVPTLEALVTAPDIEVCAVVTQPDKPAGRGRQIVEPPVKLCAQAHNIDVYQPPKLKTPEMFEALASYSPDFFVTIAYGKILRQSFLDIPAIAPLNLHASILPELRGAAPVQWAIMRGAVETGVCLMKMDAGMDTGPVYAVRKTPISERETPETLFKTLSRISAEILLDNIYDIANGKLTAAPQIGEATTAPMLSKEMAAISFDIDAASLDCLCRGMSQWPTAYALFNGKRVAFHMTHAIDSQPPADAIPGTILGLDPQTKSLLIACKSGILAVEILQIQGKSKLSAENFFNGYRPSGVVLKKAVTDKDD